MACDVDDATGERLAALGGQIAVEQGEDVDRVPPGPP
jgi:hypothetical protein